jgi:hypothetical protein
MPSSRKSSYGIGKPRADFLVRSNSVLLIRSCKCKWDREWNANARCIETKVLKQLVRDHIDPNKDLGHSDRGGKKKEAVKTGEANEEKKGTEGEGKADPKEEVKRNPDGTVCEDCR